MIRMSSWKKLSALACAGIAVVAFAGCVGAGPELEGLAAAELTGPNGLSTEDGGPISASVCVETSTAKCYCTGVGCQSFCKSVIVVSMGGGSSSTAPGVFGAFYEGMPSLSVGGTSVPDVAAVAVIGSHEEVAAGRGRMFVRDRDGRETISGTAVELDDLMIAGGRQRFSMSFLASALDSSAMSVDLR
jgi:hypothetical protein